MSNPNDSNPDEHSPETPAKPEATPSPEAPVTTKHKGVEEGDASRGEVAIYAFGNVEGSIADRFPEILQNILVVAAHLNPLLVGLVMGIRTLWDGIMDPIIAHMSDNTKSRWGRRRPYILVGGVLRCLFLLPFIYFLPIGSSVISNQLMEAQKYVNESVSTIEKTRGTLVKAKEELPIVEPQIQAKIIDVLEGRPPRSWITQIITVFSTKEEVNFVVTLENAVQTIETHLPTLEKDRQSRFDEAQTLQAEFARIQAEGFDPESEDYLRAKGLVESAQKSLENADKLIRKARDSLPDGIAAQYEARYLLTTYSDLSEGAIDSLPSAQMQANAALAQQGYDAVELFPVPEPVQAVATVSSISDEAPKGFVEKMGSAIKRAGESFLGLFKFEGLRNGIEAFTDPSNFDQRTLVLYLLVAYIIFATLTTINGAPYYALGIELSPSYEGRTQVVVYRSLINKIAGIISPWVPVFCFGLLFANAFNGLFWVAVFACAIGIPSTVLMFFKTRERTHATIKKAGERPNMFKSMWEIGKEKDFLRILFLFAFLGLVNGLFQQIGFFLNVYWVTGSALSGATLGAQVAMIAWGLGIATLPLIKWACNKFQKHRVLQFAIIWMAIGTALKWWLMDPEHPEYQFILPFFFSVGISSVYTVLPTMMADVTDLDELRYGVRREGMFGAVMGFLLKALGTITPIAAGVILVISGFSAELEQNQAPGTITNMRIMYSLVPAVMLLGGLFALRKYPLTRERVAEIKATLKQRHADERDELA